MKIQFKVAQILLITFLWTSAFSATCVRAEGADSLASLTLDPQAKILQPEQTISVPAGTGSGANLYLPFRAFFNIDFAVQPGKTLVLKILTGDQYNAVLAGRQVLGEPVVNQRIEGTASVSVQLQPGTYYIAFLSKSQTPTRVIYRATGRRY